MAAVQRSSAPPVEMGSASHLATESGDFVLTWAVFPAGAVLERHEHDRPTFALILRGGFGLTFPNPAMRRRDLQCGPGVIFSEPAGEPHANHVFEGGAEVIVVQPRVTSAALEPFARLLDRVNHFRHGGIQRLGRRLARELRAPDALSPLAAEALALEMLVEAGRLGPADRASRRHPRWLHRAEELIHEHFRERLTVRDIADEVGVHPAHLAAHFRRSHRVPLGTYLRRLRVEWAADRLALTDQPIARIAFDAGFADQPHLTRVFKQETGWTPAAWRRGRATD